MKSLLVVLEENPVAPDKEKGINQPVTVSLRPFKVSIKRAGNKIRIRLPDIFSTDPMHNNMRRIPKDTPQACQFTNERQVSAPNPKWYFES